MGSPLPQMERWSFASFSKHFQDKLNVDKPGLRIKFEGQDEPKDQPRQWVEVRMDGPLTKELSKDYHHLRVEVNILITTMQDDIDFHEHHELCGYVRSWFEKCISCFKLGDRPTDDQSFIAVYKLDTSFREQVTLSHFGVIDKRTRLIQSTVEGHYDMKETF